MPPDVLGRRVRGSGNFSTIVDQFRLRGNKKAVPGRAMSKLDDELVELSPLDAVRVSPGVARAFEAGPEGLELLIFGPHVDGDGEMVADFWGSAH